jgi:hypothetical protein
LILKSSYTNSTTVEEGAKEAVKEEEEEVEAEAEVMDVTHLTRTDAAV